MRPTGLCDICGETGGMYSCALCGRRICGNCITVKGVCKDCIEGRKMEDVPDDMVDRLV